MWVKHRTVPESGQGGSARIACMLEGQGTCRHIPGAGQHANSDDLAQAVTNCWQAYRELTPRTVREWPRRKGYHWIYKIDTKGIRYLYHAWNLHLYGGHTLTWTTAICQLNSSNEKSLLSTTENPSSHHGGRSFNAKDDHIPFFDKDVATRLWFQNTCMAPGRNIQLPKPTPLNRQPCEPDGDRFRKCMVPAVSNQGLGNSS